MKHTKQSLTRKTSSKTPVKNRASRLTSRSASRTPPNQRNKEENLGSLGYFAIIVIAALSLSSLSSCASLKKMFAVEPPKSNSLPISNPFGSFGEGKRENIVLRTKKGDRSVEVELPGSTSDMSDFELPLSPHFDDQGVPNRNPAAYVGNYDVTGGGYGDSANYGGSGGNYTSGGAIGYDDSYRAKGPSYTDREIVRTFPQGTAELEGDRRSVETELGLMPSEEDAGIEDQSYLVVMDRVKQLYKGARYEAALLELDDLVRVYPTDPKIYEMRGTLLDRLGKPDLAVRSWNQALRFDPSNQNLRRFIERKQTGRGVASQ